MLKIFLVTHFTSLSWKKMCELAENWVYYCLFRVVPASMFPLDSSSGWSSRHWHSWLSLRQQTLHFPGHSPGHVPLNFSHTTKIRISSSSFIRSRSTCIACNLPTSVCKIVFQWIVFCVKIFYSAHLHYHLFICQSLSNYLITSRRVGLSSYSKYLIPFNNNSSVLFNL